MRILLLAVMQHVLQACEGREKFVLFGPMQPALVLHCGVKGCACLAQGSPGVEGRGSWGALRGTWFWTPLKGVLEGLGSWSRCLRGTSLVLGGHLV